MCLWLHLVEIDIGGVYLGEECLAILKQEVVELLLAHYVFLELVDICRS